MNPLEPRTSLGIKCGERWIGSDAGGIAVLAVAAVDIAVWDLKSKVAGIPSHRLLGDYRDKVPSITLTAAG